MGCGDARGGGSHVFWMAAPQRGQPECVAHSPDCVCRDHRGEESGQGRQVDGHEGHAGFEHREVAGECSYACITDGSMMRFDASVWRSSSGADENLRSWSLSRYEAPPFCTVIINTNRAMDAPKPLKGSSPYGLIRTHELHGLTRKPEEKGQ